MCFEYNKLSPNDTESQQKILKNLLGKMGKDVIITQPFWCDYGYNITVGDNFYSNHNMIITDGAKELSAIMFLLPRTVALLRQNTP